MVLLASLLYLSFQKPFQLRIFFVQVSSICKITNKLKRFKIKNRDSPILCPTWFVIFPKENNSFWLC